MKSFKALAVAALLTVSSAGLTFALDAVSSPLEALSSATTLNFETVASAEALSVNSGASMEQVDLDSLKALIQQNPQFLAQLEAYGATIDDVVGIMATDETDVKIYVLG